MSIALATSTRVLLGAVVAAMGMALFAGCGDQSSERRGGGDIPDLNAGSTQMMPDSGVDGGSGGDSGAAGAPSAGPVAWCDAFKVINCVCQQCHQNPPLNGAPIPLMTYEDTQPPFPSPSSKDRVWQKMQTDVSTRAMPFIGADVTPPVQPLTDEQYDTLLTWLAEGARAEGGTQCTPTCDWSDGTPEL